jgi:beta-xylosidase
MDAYGRVVHLNPVTWKGDWPVIGADPDGDGIGEPVRTFTKPSAGPAQDPGGPPTSDEFNDETPGLQWQWHANPKQEWMFLSGGLGYMRLYCTLLPEPFVNHWDTPHLYLQKWPAPGFSAVARIRFQPHDDGDATGLIIMGTDYSSIVLEQIGGRQVISHVICRDAMGGNSQEIMERHDVASTPLYLKAEVDGGGICRFGFSEDGINYRMMKEEFTAKPGRWIGAKIGLFASGTVPSNDRGYADIDWFRIK